MAKKNTSSDFREIMKSIKKKDFAPVYLLAGDEDYYIDQIVKALEKEVVPEEEKDFNQITFYGSDADIATVMASAQQYPVMAERQLVMLKEAQAMQNAKRQVDKLSAYAEHSNSTTVLVITFKGDSFPGTSALVKSLKGGKGVYFKSEQLKDYQLAGPISDYCVSKGVRIDDKAVSLLCDYIGNPLSKLFGEIDKLIVGGGEDMKVITPELIEKNIGISKDFNTFELVNAVSKKDFARSMMIVEYFSRNPKQNPGVMVTAALFNFFSKLFIACVCRDKSDAALMAELDLKSTYALTNYRTGLRAYNSRMAYNAIQALREHDAKSKGIGSNQNEFDLLKELLFRIFTFNG